MKKAIIFTFLLIFSLWSIINVTSQSLRSIAQQLRAQGREFYIGCAVPSNFSSADQDIVRTEFDIMTAENDMKIYVIAPSEGSFNWSGGDNLVNFAKANNMIVHGHAFVWHKYQPYWVDGTKAMMESYINTVATHFRGDIYAWDVVNEAFHRDGSFRINEFPAPPGVTGQDGASIFGQRQGPQYIEDAFRAAAQADPYAKLLYNDYAISLIDAKFEGMYDMLVDFKNRGVPLHGVGFQVHVTPDYTEANAQSFAVKMQRIADLGLEIYITELDGGCPDGTAAGFETQGRIYYWIAKACLDQPICRALQVWGIRDNQSWRVNAQDEIDRAVYPLIFDDNGNRKPAYYSIQQAMLEALNGPEPTPTTNLGDVNDDGNINIVDALLIAQFYVGLDPPNFDQGNADTNCDGNVNIVDALLVAQFYVGLITGFC